MRLIAERVEVGHETLRKFIEGETDVPHRSSRKAYSRLFRAYGGKTDGLVLNPMERAEVAGVLSDLKMILAPGLKASKAEVRRIFAAARASGMELPERTTELERWLVRMLTEIYGGGDTYA
ncbi:MAG: hypothetical protein JWM27_2414 [Gemmatimonadetes bacterium]|nr:hypothetical protein [Gemmatimonadota bacterium]